MQSSPDTVRAYGPPGCGKTHAACDWIAYQVERGADADRVAFVSFTNAACDESRTRLQRKLDLSDYDTAWCATIHALCKRALGIQNRDWLADGKWLQQFGRNYGYDIVPVRKHQTEEVEEIGKSDGSDSLLLAIWEFGRARLLRTAEQAWRAFEEYDGQTAARASYHRFAQFVADYEADKRGWGKLDYTDLLIQSIEQQARIPASVAVIDEAQDNSPLLWAAADTLFRDVDARAVIADPDQAIYTFQGADPALFNERAADRVSLLRQSRRCPRVIHDQAARIIRANRGRVDTDWAPVTSAIVEARTERMPGPARASELEGEIHRIGDIQQVDLLNGETWMILARNWSFVPEIVDALERAGIPYWVQGEAYYSPWSDRGPYRAARSVITLSRGGKISIADLVCITEKTRADTKERVGAWLYGRKARIRELAESNPGATVSLIDLPYLGMTERGFKQVCNADLSVLDGISDRDLVCYQASVERGTWGQQARVRVCSIHGVKGQEADNVICALSCTPNPARNLQDPRRCEEETRLAYVAITRAKQRFYALDLGHGQPWNPFGV